MKYEDFEELFSAKRMQKYLQACGGDTRRAMTLYRYNLKLSQEMFTLISLAVSSLHGNSKRLVMEMCIISSPRIIMEVEVDVTLPPVQTILF